MQEAIQEHVIPIINREHLRLKIFRFTQYAPWQ